VGKLEQSRIILSEREKQMLESKEQKDNELQMAKTLYEEAHQRLFTGKLNQG